MKLLDKVTIEKEKNLERKKLVDEGMKLAKSVDILRQTYADEQTKLRNFRDATLKTIQNEIDVLLTKKQAVLSEITALEEKKNSIKKILLEKETLKYELLN